jgi:hypothetical protein
MTRIFRSTVTLLALVGSMSAHSQVTCPAGTIQEPDAMAWAKGKTLCAARGALRWQEFHVDSATAAGRRLIDYKLGPGHPIDPTKDVGIWDARGGNAGPSGGPVLFHRYNGGQSYSWLICREASSTSWTLRSTGPDGDITGATLRTGQVSCGF